MKSYAGSALRDAKASEGKNLCQVEDQSKCNSCSKQNIPQKTDRIMA
jgi:hypothetical protein